jgi:hypothetical protein
METSKSPYTLAGFEPGILCSGGGRDDHYATPPGHHNKLSHYLKKNMTIISQQLNFENSITCSYYLHYFTGTYSTSRLPDFSWYNVPKRPKIHPNRDFGLQPTGNPVLINSRDSVHLFDWTFHANISIKLTPWQRGIVVIASAYRTEDPRCESRQGVRFLGLYT